MQTSLKKLAEYAPNNATLGFVVLFNPLLCQRCTCQKAIEPLGASINFELNLFESICDRLGLAKNLWLPGITSVAPLSA